MGKWFQVAALSLSLSLGLAVSANAAIATFTFADLTGGDATGTLVLKDYIPGYASGQFVSWTFASSIALDDVDAGELVAFTSDLSLSYVGEERLGDAVTISSPTSYFATGVTSSAGPNDWIFQYVCIPGGPPCGGGDGPQVDNSPLPTYSWRLTSLAEPSDPSAAPEPLSWSLMILGFGLGGLRLRAARRPEAA